jgi:hypothetical protein
MVDCNIERLRQEFVQLLREQIEALELETYVGLTDAEQRDYVRRQERIRELDATISRFLNLPPLSVLAAAATATRNR